jgi:hypothetical protein
MPIPIAALSPVDSSCFLLLSSGVALEGLAILVEDVTEGWASAVFLIDVLRVFAPPVPAVERLDAVALADDDIPSLPGNVAVVASPFVADVMEFVVGDVVVVPLVDVAAPDAPV